MTGSSWVMVHSHGVTPGGYPPGVAAGGVAPAVGSAATAPVIRPPRRLEPFPGLTVFGLTECALMMIDENTVISGWSQGAENLLGYRASEVTGHSAVGLLASERGSESDGGRLSAESRWRKKISTQKPWTGMTDVRHRDGTRLRVSVEAVPLRGEDGASTWFISVSAMAGGDSSPGVSASVMRTLLDRAPIALSVWDRDLTCIWLNNSAERSRGPLGNRRIGKNVHEALPGFDTDDVACVMRQVLQDGGPVLDHEFLWSSPDGREDRVFSSSLFRFDAEDGTPLGICTIGVDITKSWARDRLSLLSEAGRRIGTTLDTARTAQELAEVGCPLLADFVTVELDESVPLSDDAPERSPSHDVEGAIFRRLGVTSLHPGVPEAAYGRGEEIYVPPSSPMYTVLKSGKSHFEPVLDVTPDGWLGEDPRRAKNVRAFGMHSMMVIPLKARGAVLGIAVFVRTVSDTPFTRDDLLLAEELAVRASLNLDNARRYTRERAAALALQRNLLPRRLSGGCALDVASRYLPTDSHEGVGGDWFDVIPLSGARVALVVGDVIGHGINAAASMGRLRTAVHTLADLDFAPDELLAHLDDLAGRLSEEQLGSDGFPTPVIGATCTYAVYDPVTRICTVARAGHPPPALVDPGGRVTFPDIPAGAPIGYGLASYESAEFELPEGSLIAMYTDGLVETRHDDIDVGLDALASALARPGTDLEELCGGVVEATLAQSKFEDDAALLLARTHVLGPDQVMSHDLSDEPMAIRAARSLALEQLSAWGLGHLRGNVELIISELVTNAVSHATGPVRLRLIRHKALVCEVYDADNRLPRLRHARVTEESGRGLLMVAELSHRWGCRFTRDGKATWAEVEIPVRTERSLDGMEETDGMEGMDGVALGADGEWNDERTSVAERSA